MAIEQEPQKTLRRLSNKGLTLHLNGTILVIRKQFWHFDHDPKEDPDYIHLMDMIKKQSWQ